MVFSTFKLYESTLNVSQTNLKSIKSEEQHFLLMVSVLDLLLQHDFFSGVEQFTLLFALQQLLTFDSNFELLLEQQHLTDLAV